MSEEWGPWIEHDGRGCPPEICVGKFMQAKYRNGKLHGGLIRSTILNAPNWFWPKRSGKIFDTDCMEYRIRKPKGLTILEEIAQGIKQPEEVA